MNTERNPAPPERGTPCFSTARWGVAGAALALACLFPADLTAQRREPLPSPFVPLGIERMSELATQVVAGTIEAMESTWNLDHSRIHTRVTMRVERVLSGQAGNRIVFRIPGGTVGDTTVMVSEMPHFRVGEETVVFLRGTRGRLPSVLGGTEGKLPLVRREDGSLGLLFPIRVPTRAASASGADEATRELDDLERLVRGPTALKR